MASVLSRKSLAHFDGPRRPRLRWASSEWVHHACVGPPRRARRWLAGLGKGFPTQDTWRRRGRDQAARRDGGFTLIELLIVITIIGIIAAIAVGQYQKTPLKAKEAVLKEDLFVLRDVIDQYFADKGKYPESLQALADDGYMRKIPVDPFTGSDSTWETVQAEASDDDKDSGGGVIDVHSGATGAALDGSRYSDW